MVHDFSSVPSVSVKRSTFKGLSHSVKTSFNVGSIVPFYLEPVYPGDTFDVRSSKVVRLQTLITPMMDNLFLDTYFFFVPNRLVWEHFEQFIGGSQDEDSPWIPVPEYSVPQIQAPASTGYLINSLADYFGYPTGVPDYQASALPFRAYAKIVNDWFISENLTEPYYFSTGDATVTALTSTADEVNAIHYACKPVLAAKTMDYFTACLPAPQKGPDVSIPIAQDNLLPVFANKYVNKHFSEKPHDVVSNGYLDALEDAYPIYFDFPQNDAYLEQPSMTHITPFFKYGGSTDQSDNNYLKWVDAYKSSDVRGLVNYAWDASTPGQKLPYAGEVPLDDFASWRSLTPVNLVAELNPVFSSINQLRLAFQIQKLYERDARGGTRYVELLRSHFGVTSPDARLQRSEYLGGSRFPISVHQVTQTSATSGESPLGETGALSVTADVHHDFTKSFVEHGYIIGVMVARYDHTYQQGLPRHLSAKNRFQWFWPALSAIGEQAVLNKELYLTGTETDDEVFGYQEAWADLRYHPNRVTGEMRSADVNSLDMWHLADDYESLPYLSDSWLREDWSNVDRVLQVTSSVANQIFGDIYLDIKATRPLPLYSVPGLIDHF